MERDRDEVRILNQSSSAGKSINNFFNLLKIRGSGGFIFGDVAKARSEFMNMRLGNRCKAQFKLEP